MDDGIEAALEQFCFFVSNKSRDEEIKCLKRTASNASTTWRKPSLFVSLITVQSLKVQYFHEKCAILYFRQILMILSPQWLARLFNCIITVHPYKRGKGFDDAWKQLANYGILHVGLLQHMLDKFHSDYPSVVKISQEQVVDILFCFPLVARITREAWFSDDGHPSLPENGDTFIVPSLVFRNNRRKILQTPNKRESYTISLTVALFQPVYWTSWLPNVFVIM